MFYKVRIQFKMINKRESLNYLKCFVDTLNLIKNLKRSIYIAEGSKSFNFPEENDNIHPQGKQFSPHAVSFPSCRRRNVRWSYGKKNL